MNHCYINYKNGSVVYDLDNHSFELQWTGNGPFLREGRIAGIYVLERTIRLGDFSSVETTVAELDSGGKLTLVYSGGPEHVPAFSFEFFLKADGITLYFRFREDSNISVEGLLSWGKDLQYDTFACRLDHDGGPLRVGLGPASSCVDNTLFDRLSDSALSIHGHRKLRLRYDWNQTAYQLLADTGEYNHNRKLSFVISEHYYQRKFHIPWKPINKATQFPTPPVGWMTWYALKHDTSEQGVLRNARWLEKNLAPFGANCIWVDWEWYHSRNFSVDEHPDVNTFSPDPRRYPSGMTDLARQIRSLGLVPALWIGATNDPNKNSFLEKNPECILTDKPAWCGRWWIDPSHPKVIEEYIPMIFEQMLGWGFEAFKWDCLPTSLEIADEYHDRFHDPTQSSEEALRDVIGAGRKTIGPNRYMMSCSGHAMRDITFAMDQFDGGRVGGDIFSWEDFIREAVQRLYAYLCFHNVVFLNDLDNLVIRSEYNSFDQAVSRVSFAALSGTPITLGDDLPELEPNLVEMLRRIVPAVDFHPMDLDKRTLSDDLVVVNARIAKRFESWNVVDVFNTSAEPKSVRIALGCDLHLELEEGERYLVFDFWKHCLLGIFDRVIELELPPHGSQVLGVRLCLDRPQVLSTSRHVTQGAPDLLNISWDQSRQELIGCSNVVAGDLYILSIYCPECFTPKRHEVTAPGELSSVNDCVCRLLVRVEESKEVEWSVHFTQS